MHFLQSIYVKILFGAVVGFIGIVGGIYVGHAITGAGQQPKNLPQAKSGSLPYMTLNPGDLFPLEPFTDSAGQAGNFEQLLHERRNIVFFTHFGCSRCMDLLKFWNTALYARLYPDVRQIACLPKSTKEIPPEYAALLRNMTVVYIDDKNWEATYHLVMWPVLIGVDASGFVTHIQHGFDDTIDHEIVEGFLKPGQ